MANRNIALGGASNWADGEILTADDLNDTFDAAADKIQTLSVFWRNTYLYDIYDDFESYSTGAFTSNANWNIPAAGANTTVNSTITTSSNPTGSSSKVLKQEVIRSGSNGISTHIFNSILLADDKHKHLKLYAEMNTSNDAGSPTNSVQVKLGSAGTLYTIGTIVTNTTGGRVTGSIVSDISVIAQGSNSYDLYVGGKLVEAGISEADPQLYIQLTTEGSSSDNYTFIEIDDVVESKQAI